MKVLDRKVTEDNKVWFEVELVRSYIFGPGDGTTSCMVRQNSNLIKIKR